MAAELSRDDVVAAREAIAGRLHRTPVFSSATLGERAGAPVYLKAELFQRTGSFKPRGVLTKLASLSDEEKRRGVIGISAGNHAQALAYCAALEGIDALLVMWEGASPQKIEATRAYGASVDLEANGPGEAFDRLHELIEESGRPLVHPFDDPKTIAGQGTVGIEIFEDGLAAYGRIGHVWKLALAGAAGLLQPALEPLHAAARVDELLLPRVERMALGADLDVQIGLRRARLELVATGAANDREIVVRVDSSLHLPRIAEAISAATLPPETTTATVSCGSTATFPARRAATPTAAAGSQASLARP